MILNIFDLTNYTFNPYALPPFIIALSLLILGVVALIRERGTPVSFLFFLVALTASIWLLFFSIMYFASDKRVAYLWMRMANIGIPFIPPAVYSFTVAVLHIYDRRKLLVWLSWGLSSIYFVLATGTDLFITGLYHYRWGFYPQYGWFAIPSLIVFFGILVLSLYEFLKEYPKGDSKTHQLRIKSFTVAFSIAYLGSVDYFPAYGVPIYPFGYVPIFLFLIMVARTITHYRFVDITPSFAAHQIIATIADLLIVCDADNKIRVVNHAASSITGYREKELLGMPMDSFMEAFSKKEFLREVMQNGKVQDKELTCLSKDGRSIDVSVSISPLNGPDQTLNGFVVIGQDIRERKKADKEMKNTLSLLNATLDSTADGILVVNKEGKFINYNQKFVKMWDIPDEIIASQDDARAISYALDQLKDPDGFIKKVKELYAQPEAESMDILELKDGKVFERYSRPQWIAGETVGRVWSFRNVTERKKAEERLVYLANHDGLTNLPNRLLLVDRLNQAIFAASRHNRLIAVMFLDLDRFKVINDTLGHSTTDLLLRAVGKRLSDSVRQGDTVSRIGGDEFVVILTDVAHSQDAVKSAQKILTALSKPFNLEGSSFFITASIGISLYPADGKDSETLLKNADAAMFRAKDRGRNNLQLYSFDMNAKAAHRLSLETSLRRALEQQEFLLYYQPFADFNTGQIVGMEALLRWQSPDRGLVLPGDFIPVAEDSGLIIQIGEWVLRTACEQNKAWQNEGLPLLRVAVNLSSLQFKQQNLIETVGKILQETDLEPRYLEFEITESLLMQNVESTILILHEFHRMGIEISIDDFGTGYSSLSYLKRFPVNSLKIDRFFVKDVITDTGSAAIAKAIVTLAHSLNLKVIAEGVETEEQRRFLQSIKCNEMQGYLFSQPLSAEEFRKRLEENKSVGKYDRKNIFGQYDTRLSKL